MSTRARYVAVALGRHSGERGRQAAMRRSGRTTRNAHGCVGDATAWVGAARRAGDASGCWARHPHLAGNAARVFALTGGNVVDLVRAAWHPGGSVPPSLRRVPAARCWRRDVGRGPPDPPAAHGLWPYDAFTVCSAASQARAAPVARRTTGCWLRSVERGTVGRIAECPGPCGGCDRDRTFRRAMCNFAVEPRH